MCRLAGPTTYHERHDEIRAKIDASEPGYAQATVAGQLVSYHRHSLNGFAFDRPMPDDMHHSDIMEALILEVTTGRGRATAQTFPNSFARMMIATRRAYNASFQAMHAEADAIAALYRAQPELFYT